PSDGSPVTVSDTLPSGLAYDPSGALQEAGVEITDYRYTYNAGVEEGFFSCSEGPPVACTDTHVVPPGDSVYLWVPVSVEGGAPGSVVNHVSASGGGAPSASASETTMVGSGLPSFGFQRFDGGFLGGEGSSVSQAGAHPYQAVFDFSVNTLPYLEGHSGRNRLDPAGNLKQLTVNLPAGIVVNPL